MVEQEPLIGSPQQRPPSYTELPDHDPPPTGYLQAYQQQQDRATEQQAYCSSPYDYGNVAPPPSSPYPEPNPALRTSWANIPPPPDPSIDGGTLHRSDIPILKLNVNTRFRMTVIMFVLWLIAFPLTWMALPFALMALCFAIHSRHLANKSGGSYYENAITNGKRAFCCSIFSLFVTFASGFVSIFLAVFLPLMLLVPIPY